MKKILLFALIPFSVFAGTLTPVGMDATTGQQKISAVTDIVTVPKLTGMGSTPMIAIGTGAGTTGTPTATVVGTDLGGTITVNTGTVLTPVAGGVVATLTFNTSGSAAPNCVLLTPANSITALLSGSGSCYVNSASITNGGFPITAGTTALIGATTYKFYYHVIW